MKSDETAKTVVIQITASGTVSSPEALSQMKGLSVSMHGDLHCSDCTGRNQGSKTRYPLAKYSST